MKFETKEIRKEKKSNFTRNRKSVVRSKLFISFSTSISLPLHLSPFFVTSSIIVHCPASPHDPTSQLPFVMIASSPNPSRPHCCSPRVGHPPVGTGCFQVNGGREVLKKRLSFDVLFFFENWIFYPFKEISNLKEKNCGQKKHIPDKLSFKKVKKKKKKKSLKIVSLCVSSVVCAWACVWGSNRYDHCGEGKKPFFSEWLFIDIYHRTIIWQWRRIRRKRRERKQLLLLIMRRQITHYYYYRTICIDCLSINPIIVLSFQDFSDASGTLQKELRRCSCKSSALAWWWLTASGAAWAELLDWLLERP